MSGWIMAATFAATTVACLFEWRQTVRDYGHIVRLNDDLVRLAREASDKWAATIAEWAKSLGSLEIAYRYAIRERFDLDDSDEQERTTIQ